MKLTRQDMEFITRLIGRGLHSKTLKGPVFVTTNPGPNGHKWVKKRFVDKNDEEL